ncbi:MAG TPA: SpoIIE family protein phosphatase [Terracidiphilus sp.]|nr:SpoIIE family protein phosphatase [Terracidiphilus sp.]
MLPRKLGFTVLLTAALFALGSVTLRADSSPKVAPPPASVLTIDGLGKGTAPLNGPWQFHLGDNPAWSSPAFDDYFWSALSADKPWGMQGHESYTGYAWYRIHLDIHSAPGASPDLALLLPGIDDVYQIYWNGQEIGHLGHMPPHWVWYSSVPAQTFGLGRATSGVLAIRVWKSPLYSTDPGTGGGFQGVPIIGSPQAIAQAKGNLDFHWLSRNQFQFALSSLYGLTAIVCFFFWYRDQKQWLLFWMAMYSTCLVAELFLGGLRLQISTAALVCVTQTEISIREMSLWFLLLWLLKLQDNRRLVVLVRKAALVSVTASTLDGLLILFYPTLLSAVTTQIIDALITPAIIFFEALPIIIVAYAFLRGKPLESARWIVAAVAFLNGMLYFLQNIASQGVRFTHWTLPDKMHEPLFTFAGNPIQITLLFRTLLFFAILYAVTRFSLEHRRRTTVLEQEFQSARELQRVLVPSSLPIIPGFTLTSAYRPAQEVGGDFFQIIPLESGPTVVVLGDVSGKGLMAAMAVSLIVGAVRALVEEHPAPAELLTLLNRRLFGRLQGGFATCVIMRLETNGDCVVSSAGHPAPFLNDREMELPGALPLGIAHDVQYEESVFQLEVGDRFSLYTDGLLEARNQAGELYSFARLERLFAGHPSAAQATQAAVNFGQDDDITVLTLTRLATGEDGLALNLA